MTSFLLAFDNQSISHNKLFVETETIVTKREKLPTLALDNADGVKKKNEVSAQPLLEFNLALYLINNFKD